MTGAKNVTLKLKDSFFPTVESTLSRSLIYPRHKLKMQFSTLITLALAVAPAVIAAPVKVFSLPTYPGLLLTSLRNASRNSSSPP